MNKEEIYDSQISPLMQQVIEICKANGIAALTSFSIGHDGEGPNGEDCTNLTCTTHLPDMLTEEFDPRFSKAVGIIQQRSGRIGGMAMNITTTNADGSQTLTAVI